METITIFAAIAAGILLGALVAWFLMKGKANQVAAVKDAEIKSLKEQAESASAQYETRLVEAKEQGEKNLAEAKEQAEKLYNETKAQYDKHLSEAKELSDKHLQEAREAADKNMKEAKEQYESSVAELKKAHEENLKAVKDQLELENEKMLKAREESLKKEAQENFENITKTLREQVKDMKDAFEKQKTANTEESSSLKTKFDEAVKHMKESTENIGNQADNLAKAIRGKNKMQGVFGETILENILMQEGLQKGRDYDSESYLRDNTGRIIENNDTGHKMRPDFILHYPDNTDVIIDAKASFPSLGEYFEAETDEERKIAAAKNLESVKKHIEELASKEYQKYVENKKTLEFVIMFIPNYGTYQLAKQEDPEIFSKAFKENVLITTEETLIPFLRLIRSAWVQKDQVDNMNKIVEAATKMIDRVGIFCENNAKVKDLLDKTVKAFDANTNRLIDGQQSIVKAAKDVENYGIKLSPNKILPDVHN